PEWRGVGNVFNVPRPGGLPRAVYGRDFLAGVDAALERWTPDILLISAGFDSLAGDPLGEFTLEPDDIVVWTEALRARMGNRPIAAVLEGGYRLDLLAAGVVALVRALSLAGDMALKLIVEQASITTRHPFAIARGSTNGYKRAWVRLVDGNGQEGWGEADPSSFYGESLETVLKAFERLGPHLPLDPFDLEAAEARWAQLLPKNWSARAALSAALHDLVGKALGQPLWRLWGLDPRKAPLSSFTIGLDTTEKIRDKVREAKAYPILKIKLGTDRDETILKTIRDATDKPIRVDANAGWDVARAKHVDQKR